MTTPIDYSPGKARDAAGRFSHDATPKSDRPQPPGWKREHATTPVKRPGVAIRRGDTQEGND
jgi:hypothetical protein